MKLDKVEVLAKFQVKQTGSWAPTAQKTSLPLAPGVIHVDRQRIFWLVDGQTNPFLTPRIWIKIDHLNHL
jgi:hypothetical protein